jgi:KTSC domain
MKMQKVASSNIRAVGYENGELQIEFTTGRRYSYSGPRVEEHYKAMMAAESPGRYFASQIRPDPVTTAMQLTVVGYTVLSTERGAAGCPPAGTRVYRGNDMYGLAADDTRIKGIDYVACSVNESGLPFFTIPREDLEPIYG